jgi:hypothetical protein
MPRVKKYVCICMTCHKTTRAPLLCEGCYKSESVFGACDFCYQFGECECGGPLLPQDIIRSYCKPTAFIELMDDVIGDCRTYGSEGEPAAKLWKALMEGDYGK